MLAFFSQTPRSANNMIELSQRRTASPRAPRGHGRQQSRLLIALALLLVALTVVLIKDRQFWFGSESTILDANEVQQPAASQPAAKSTATPAAAVPARPARKHVVSDAPAEPKPADTPAVVTRTVLPPLDVEVIAGDTHRNLHPKSNTTKVQIAKPGTSAIRQAAPAPTVNAAQHERIAEATVPAYPALAQHMNVQGSVVLQALIAADGTIQNLRVASGPAILAAAAKQAVSEWHFKPVLENGQAVETRATITVNFTIKVADSSSNTTLADSQVSDQLIITR